MNKKELINRCEELGLDVQALNDASENATATNAELEQAIAEAEAKLTSEEEVETTENVYEDDRGLSWVFKKSAPKTINIDGRAMTQKEIIETEEVISDLVYGNSSFLKLKN